MRRTLAKLLLVVIASCAPNPNLPPPAQALIVMSAGASADVLDLTAATTTSAIAVACVDHTKANATGQAIDDQTLVFSPPVPACGSAQLTLTVWTGANQVKSYEAVTSTPLTSGEVDVSFSGPLYGEVQVMSQTGSLQCTLGQGPFTATPTGFIVALPAGDYTLSCSDSAGDNATAPVTVTAKTRGSLTLQPTPPAGTPPVTTPPVATPSGPTGPTGPPHDATLASLVVGSGTLTPIFSPTVSSYTDTEGSIGSIAVGGTTDSPQATVALNGAPAQTGTFNFTTTLALGTNPLTLVVTAPDGVTTSEYLVVVTVPVPNDVAVTAIDTALGGLNPPFSTNTTSYSLLLSAREQSLGLALDVPNDSATVTVNGSPPGGPVALTAADTVITIVVTAQTPLTDQVTYSIAVHRGMVQGLSSSLPVAAFSVNQSRYDLLVPQGTSQLGVTTTFYPGATVTVSNGGASQLATSASALPVSLNNGVNPILVEASAPGGEYESYWIRAVVPPVAETYLAVSNGSAELALQPLQSASGPPGTVGVPADTSPYSIYTMTAAVQGNIVFGGDTSFGEIVSYLVDANGDLTSPATPTAVTALLAIAADPKGRYLYVLNNTTLASYAYDPTSGALTDQNSVAVSGASQMAVDPQGRFIALNAPGSIVTYFLAPDGSFSPTATSYSASSTELAIDSAALPAVTGAGFAPGGNFVYYTNGPGLFQLSIDPLQGTLTTSAQTNPLFSSPSGLAAGAGGAYVTDYNATLYFFPLPLQATTTFSSSIGTLYGSVVIDDYDQMIYSAAFVEGYCVESWPANLSTTITTTGLTQEATLTLFDNY